MFFVVVVFNKYELTIK